jgi:hypothetical protein
MVNMALQAIRNRFFIGFFHRAGTDNCLAGNSETMNVLKWSNLAMYIIYPCRGSAVMLIIESRIDRFVRRTCAAQSGESSMAQIGPIAGWQRREKPARWHYCVGCLRIAIKSALP